MEEKPKLNERLFWISPDYLKAARNEIFGLSQEALAKEVGITRQVLANYETRRSLRATDDALSIYKVLALKGSALALRAVLELLDLQKESCERQILQVESEFQKLERKRDAVKDWLADVKSEQLLFRAMRKTTLASLKHDKGVK